jgi:hypothetical protein
MDIREFVEYLESAFESLEEDISFDGPYTDAVMRFPDDVIEIPFEDGQRFRLSIEKIT